MDRAYFIPYVFSQLAQNFSQEDFLAYEGSEVAFFAFKHERTLRLFSDRVELQIAGKPVQIEISQASPSENLRQHVKKFFPVGRKIFAWINFEFCQKELDVAPVPKDSLLAVLFMPQVEIQWQDGRLDFVGNKKEIKKLALEIEKITHCFEDQKTTIANVAVKNIDYKSDADYVARVSQALEEIKREKYEKVILSRKVKLTFNADFPLTYWNGRLNNTPARSFLLRYQKMQALGFSPELVLKVYSDGRVISQPLAGTRRLTEDKVENIQLRRSLYTDTKEVFEHAISVKTSIREISSISQNAEVQVTEFMVIKERGSVQHLASRVEGMLAAGEDMFSALSALFPAVTASGLPKREAIYAISRLDNSPRELYAGAVGYLDLEGHLEMTLVLRSLFQQDGETYLRAGAGIVSASIPQKELEETTAKLACLAPFVVPALSNKQT
ncbi:MAG: salicylate synthase [Neisseriaceae bacterium]